MEQQQAYRISVDIGGTFTDLVILDEATSQIRTLKVSSTPRDPSEAVLTAVRRARDEFALDLDQVNHFTHASTVASNCLLEAKGARAALLTTAGFEDVLEIRRHKRYRLFDLNYRKTSPLVARRLVVGAKERIGANGDVVIPLDEAALRTDLRALAGQGVEAVAICFLFSFKNPIHEQRALEIAREELPGRFITCSSDIFPQFREYERASTTVVNAYLGPRVGTYLQRMNGELGKVGVTTPLQLMQSNGGVISWREGSAMPCRVVESGPAAGVIAAAHFGRLIGRNNLISFDMGGTTAKAGLIENGEVRQAAGQEVGAGINVSRILQGGGYFIGAATVDLAEVGAGGGSIAWLDEGVLKVGPHSAGADPGPIAYGLGGTNVTVTDANLLLGRVPADHFLGGEMTLDVEAARVVVERDFSQPLGVSVDEACSAIVDVADASMLKMLRIVSVEKGYDPADFTLVAFGGNGAVHGPELADDIGIHEVLIPPVPGLLSAQGLLVADLRYDFRQTHVMSINEGDLEEVERLFAALEEKGREALRQYGMSEASMSLVRMGEIRYPHQAYEIPTPMPAGKLGPDRAAEIKEAFHQAHEMRYGRRDAKSDVEFVTLTVTAKGEIPRPEHRPLAEGNGSAEHARTGSRKVYFRDIGRVDCAHYDRAKLLAGDRLAGPAVIHAVDSTAIVLPGWSLLCDTLGNLILTKEGTR